MLDRRRACETVTEQQEVAAVVSGIAVVRVIVGVDACAAERATDPAPELIPCWAYVE